MSSGSPLLASAGCPEATSRPGAVKRSTRLGEIVPVASGVTSSPSSGSAVFAPSASRNAPSPVPAISVPSPGSTVSDPTNGAAAGGVALAGRARARGRRLRGRIAVAATGERAMEPRGGGPSGASGFTILCRKAMSPSASTSPGRPRDPRRDEAIRDATLTLLADVGYERMSLDAIAAAACVSKPTIYRRWAGKHELVADAIRTHPHNARRRPTPAACAATCSPPSASCPSSSSRAPTSPPGSRAGCARARSWRS